MKPQRRPYQSEFVAGIYSQWNAGHRNVVGVMPTGAGKTKTFASMIDELQGSITIIAHRKELVGQISATVGEFEIPHNIIASEGSIKNCVHRHVAQFGRSFYAKRSRVTVASVDTLLVNMDKLAQWGSEQRFWITDECFPAGTLIDGKPIETIQVGDMVTAFDESDGSFSKRRVTRLFKNPEPKSMVLVKTCSHHVIRATSGHPFWTKRGWVNAGNLLESDTLLTLRQGSRPDGRITEVQVQENESDILFSQLRLRAPGRATGSESESAFDMREVRLCGDQAGLCQDRSTLLQSQMLDGTSVRGIVSDDGRDKPETRLGSNETEKPNVQRVGAGNSFTEVAGNEPSTASTRRERQACDNPRIHPHGEPCGYRVRVADCCADGSPKADSLENRLWPSQAEDSDRSGWPKSSVYEATRIGSPQGSVSEWVGLESIQVLEQGNSELFSDGYVYNIEVDDLHTYIANGIVVHNCHHVLQNNKWGKALALFPVAYGLGVTATPIRADRKSLARSQAGVFDAMVIGPSMRDLIEAGNLCDYVIYAPPLSINLDNLKVGASGEYTGESVRKESHRSQIVGDMVAHYARFAAGKRTIVFAVDVEQSEEIATRFRDAGYRAAAVDGTTPENVRDMTVDKFSRGVLDILVNVDLFGEGFDVPAVECVIMGRPTQSFGLYTQQFGRALRPLSGKPHGIIIDCVGNVGFHGLPDSPRKWSLLSEERGRRRERDPDAVPIKRCLNDACMKAYPATNRACPYCGFIPEPAGRSLPEQVDGDLMMLDAVTLAKMRGAVARIDDSPQVPLHLIGTPAEKAIIRNWQERQSAQADLRASIAAWAGVCHAAGDDDPTIHRRFYFRFGTDILTAQTLGVTDAKNLLERIDTSRNSQ